MNKFPVELKYSSKWECMRGKYHGTTHVSIQCTHRAADKSNRNIDTIEDVAHHHPSKQQQPIEKMCEKSDAGEDEI